MLYTHTHDCNPTSKFDSPILEIGIDKLYKLSFLNKAILSIG